MASQRTWFHLVYRLLIRLYQGISVGARPGAPLWLRWAAPAFAVGDVASGVALWRTPGLALAPRLAADSADTTFWSFVSPGVDDTSVLIGVPLAAEAGIRLGVAAVAIPAANASVAALVNRVRGRRAHLGGFVWQFAAVAAGIGSAAYERNWRRATTARRARELEARREQALLAGQNALAMSVDSAVDLLTRTVPLLYPTDGMTAPVNLLADWKRTLALQTEMHATYLSVALRRWESRHNDRPDLSADVDIDLPEDQGTVVLSMWQAGWLRTTFEQMRLRGRVAVEVSQPERARVPNRPISLTVNGTVVTIPRDPLPELEPFDLGPVVLVAQAAWFLGTCLRGQAESRVEAVALPAAASVALAVWSARRLQSDGDTAHGPMLLGALCLVVVQAALATRTMRAPRTSSGLRRFPTASSLIAASILAALYWPELNRSQQASAALLFSGALGVGLVQSPERLGLRDLASECLWPASAALSGVRLPARIRQEAARLDQALLEEQEEELIRAFDEGRVMVADLVADAHRHACAILRQNRARLDPRLAEEAERRLVEVAARLEGLAGLKRSGATGARA
jgi:hypothetical protein